jgi:hypothetical protein
MSLHNQVLDFSDDTEKQIFKDVASGVPGHLKTASVVQGPDLEKLASSEFALLILTKEGSTLRKFPINDSANTWMSCQYFEKTAGKLPPVAQKIAAANLKRACALYGIEATEKVAAANIGNIAGNKYNESLDFTKRAEPVKFESFVEDGSEHFYALPGRYAMPNPEFVKKAAQYFVDFEREFADAQDRHQFAENVLARAEELETPLEHKATLKKYAGEGYGDILDTQIRMREELLQHKPEMQAALKKLASHRADTEASVFAKALYAFDKKASLERYYGRALSDAFRSTFETRFTKEASGYTWDSESADLSVNEKELVKAAEEKYDKIKGYFGASVADQLKKHAVAIFDSLPSDAKEVIAKIAKGKI